MATRRKKKATKETGDAAKAEKAKDAAGTTAPPVLTDTVITCPNTHCRRPLDKTVRVPARAYGVEKYRCTCGQESSWDVSKTPAVLIDTRAT